MKMSLHPASLPDFRFIPPCSEVDRCEDRLASETLSRDHDRFRRPSRARQAAVDDLAGLDGLLEPRSDGSADGRVAGVQADVTKRRQERGLEHVDASLRQLETPILEPCTHSLRRHGGVVLALSLEHHPPSVDLVPDLLPHQVVVPALASCASLRDLRDLPPYEILFLHVPDLLLEITDEPSRPRQFL